MKYKDRIKQLGIFLLAGLLAVQPVSVSAVEAGVTSETQSEAAAELIGVGSDVEASGNSTASPADDSVSSAAAISDDTEMNDSTQLAAEASDTTDDSADTDLSDGTDGELIYDDEEQSLEDDTSVSDTDLTAETDEELVIDESLTDDEETDETEAETEEVDIYDESMEAGDASDGSFAAKSRVRRAASNRTFQSCYGDQLSGDAKTIYDAMTAVWADGGTGEVSLSLTYNFSASFTTASDGSIKWVGQTEDENYQSALMELRTVVQAAFDAFVYDNPEVFWLNSISYSFTIATTYEKQAGTIKNITISGKERWEGAQDSISSFQTAVEAAVAEVSSRVTADMSDAQKMKVIHDYICEICTYQEDNLYAHTAYGTFMIGSVVCEGYAKGFKILCNRLGITCVLGAGDAVKPYKSEGHMWNYVKLDGQWYMVDATWDDQSTGAETTYLFAGAETQGSYYVISTERVNYDKFSAGTYSSSFVQPTLAEDTYHEASICDVTQTANWCVLCAKQISYEIQRKGSPGHSYDAWTVSKVATCTETGTRVKACKICGTVIETETIPATGHSYGSYVVTQPATIFAAGVKTRTCSSCGKKETASIAKIAATVKLTAKSVPLKKGQSIQAGKLIAKKFDEDSIASVKTSNKNVVSVSGTKLTGKKAGKSAKITIKMKSGASATITVKVQKSAVSVTKLTVAKKSVKLKVGQKYALNAQLSPVTCTKKITYSSNKKKIAAVSSKGVITAKKKGTATITVKAGKKTVKVKVRVTK